MPLLNLNHKPTYKILVVDDDPITRAFVQAALRVDGFQVFLAKDGKEGLEKAMRTKPDLILMDVMMPDQDGAETALQMREQLSLISVPIVFLTALTSDSKSGDDVIMVEGDPYPAMSKMLDQEEILSLTQLLR